MNISYREANLNDLAQLKKLEQAVVDAERPFNQSIKEGPAAYYDIAALIENDNACLIIAEENEFIIGSGYAQIRESKTYLEHDLHSYLGFMYVASNYRGQGINQTIIERLMAWSRSKNVDDFYLDVYSQNTAAIKAYEKVGFKANMTEMKLSHK